MHSFQIGDRSVTEVGTLLCAALKALDAIGVKQRDVQDDLDYPYLSHAKYPKRYQKTGDPYLCYGRDRRDILLSIVKRYGLIYDEELNTFSSPQADEQGLSKRFYVFYYYDPHFHEIETGLLTFLLPNSVRLVRYRKGVEMRNASWSGQFTRTGSYLYLELKDSATQQLQAFHNYSTGLLGLWQPVYQGIFSNFTHDGMPMAGISVIEQATSKQEALERIQANTYPPAIAACIKKTTIAPKVSLPPSIDHLYPDLSYDFLVGNYTFIYQSGEELRRAKLELALSQDAALSLTTGSSYRGYFNLIEHTSLEISVREQNERGREFGGHARITCKVKQVEPQHRAFSSIIVGDNTKAIPEAFPAVLFAEGVFASGEQEGRFVQSYFKQFNANIQAQDYYQFRNLLDSCRE